MQAAIVASLTVALSPRREQEAEGPLVPVNIVKPAMSQNPPPPVRVPRDTLTVQKGRASPRPARAAGPPPANSRERAPEQPASSTTEAIAARPEERIPEDGGTSSPDAAGAPEGAAGMPGGIAGGTPALPGNGWGADGAVKFQAAMTAPVLIDGPPLSYTPQALERLVEGTMIVECVVAVDGSVHRCRVLQGLPFMDRAVVRNLEQRRYVPAKLGGEPVAVEYTFRIRLALPR